MHTTLFRLLRNLLGRTNGHSVDPQRHRDSRETLRLAIRGLGEDLSRDEAKVPRLQDPMDELACVSETMSKLATVKWSEIIDPRVIERICQFDDGSPVDTLSELIGLFLELTPKRIAHLKRSLAETDWHAVSMEAHSLKSSSANLGVKKVFAVCRRLEAIENHPDFPMASRLISEIEAEYQIAAESLTELLKQRLPARKASA